MRNCARILFSRHFCAGCGPVCTCMLIGIRRGFGGGRRYIRRGLGVAPMPTRRGSLWTGCFLFAWQPVVCCLCESIVLFEGRYIFSGTSSVVCAKALCFLKGIIYFLARRLLFVRKRCAFEGHYLFSGTLSSVVCSCFVFSVFRWSAFCRFALHAGFCRFVLYTRCNFGRW